MSLERFLEAQEADYVRALAEIQAGLKTTHWMWYIFPQLAALGYSERAKHYGLLDLAEAQSYLAHPVLGPRLKEISEAMLRHAGTSPEVILGPVDAVKLRSCATLFNIAGDGPFRALLDTYYRGETDPLTLLALDRDPKARGK